jgi:WD40 repeat protein
MSERRRGLAFLVGIDKYDDDNLPDFAETSTQDAKKLQSIFTYRDFSQYKVAKTLTGRVERTELETELKNFLSSEQCNDFLIYFSGHGYQIDVKECRQGFLATSDCKIAMSGDKIIGQERGLSYQELGTMVAGTKLNSLVLILDACHSGYAVTDDIMKASLQLKSGFSYYIIASSMESQEAMTDGKLGMGAFTATLIDKLNDLNSDVITADDLFDYGADKLDKSHYLQNPIIISRRYQSIVLVGNPTVTKAPICDEAGIVKNPYQGLKPFEAKEYEFFYGRETFVDEIVDRLKKTAFVPIVGASGSGKSSVVKAGLFPELAHDSSWECMEFKPGSNPLRKLTSELEDYFEKILTAAEEREVLESFVRKPSQDNFVQLLGFLPKDKKILLLIDQFEETFTLTSRIKDDGEQQEALKDQRTFIEIITKTEEPLHIVTTMRADFLEPCLRFDSLNSLIQSYALFIPPLQGQSLRDAIQKPAERQGVRVEAQLVDRLEEELAKEPGALPLLQFALTKLWESQQLAGGDFRELTLAAYESLGNESFSGLKGALNNHANDVYDYSDWEKRATKRGEVQQDWIRRIFLQLIRPGEGAKDTRQPQSKGSLLSIAGNVDSHKTERQELNDLIMALVNARLLVTGAPEQKLLAEQLEQQTPIQQQEWAEENEVVALTHEALIDGWLLFSKWRKENKDLLRLRARIEDQKKNWEEQRYDDNHLLNRGLLAQIEQVSWEELQPYIIDGADRDFYKRSKSYVANQDAAEKRRTLELQLISELQLQSQLQVDAIRIEKQIALKPAHEILSAAIQLVGTNREHFPNRLIGSVPASLRQVIENIVTSSTPDSHGGSVTSVAFSPDGLSIVSGSQDGTVRLWKLDGTPAGFDFMGNGNPITSVAFSPDGLSIVSGSQDGTVRLWNLDGTPIGLPFTGHTGSVTSVAFSPNGLSIVSGSESGSSHDHTVRLWNLDGTPIGLPFKGHGNSINSVAFSPDGLSIVSGSDDCTVRLWELDGTPIGLPFKGHTDLVTSVAFSPDGLSIVSGSDDCTVRLWGLDGIPIGLPFEGHTGLVTSVAFSPDGVSIVSGGDYNTVRLWGLDGIPIGLPFAGHSSSVTSVAFSRDGLSIVSGSDDSTVRLWKLDGTPIGFPFAGHSSSVTSVAFSRDGLSIVSGGDDSTVRLWKLDGTPIGLPFEGHTGSVQSVAFSPDGFSIVSGSDDSTVRLWKLDGTPIGLPFEGHSSSVTSVAFSHDGLSIVSGSDDSTVRLWKLDGTPIGLPFEGHTGSVTSVAFSHDGLSIVSGSQDGTVRLWKLDGTPIGLPFEGHTGSVTSVAFSHDGLSIVSGSQDGTVRLWKLDGTPIGLPFEGHTGSVTSVAFSHDGLSIVSGSQDGTVRLWKLDGTPIGLPFEGHTGSVTSVAFSSDGVSIVSGGGDNTVRLWKLDGTPISLSFKSYQFFVTSVAFSPDGLSIVSGSFDSTVRLWKLDGSPIGTPFKGHENSVNSVAFSPDGLSIISSSDDNTVRLWKLDGTPIGLPFKCYSVRSVAFSLDGVSIVSGGADYTIRLWKLDGSPIVLTFTGHENSVNSVAFSPDGLSIVSSSDDNTIRLWNLDGTPIGFPFKGHGSSVNSVAFSPDGLSIVSGSDDNTVRLWNLDGIPIGLPFTGHTDLVTSVAFSPDGLSIVSGSEDSTVRLWNLDGTPIGLPFTGHSTAITSVAFSPDGMSIVSGSLDNTLRLWKHVGWRSWLCTCLQRLGKNWNYDKNGIVYRTSLFEEGYSLAEQGQIELATDRFKQALHTGKNVMISKGEDAPSPEQSESSIKPIWLEQGRYIAKGENALSLEQIEASAKKLVSPIVLEQGRYFARKGEHDSALAKFRQAKQLDSGCILDPETEAKQLTAPILKMQGTFAALNNNIPEAIAKFEQAQQYGLDLGFEPEVEAKRISAPFLLFQQGQQLAEKLLIEEAIAKFEQARQDGFYLGFEPEAEAKRLAAPKLVEHGKTQIQNGHIQQAFDNYKLAQSYDQSLEIPSTDWNILLRNGSLHAAIQKNTKLIKDLLAASEKSLETDPPNHWYLDNLGVAKVLSGDQSLWQSAIKNFEFYIEKSDSAERKEKRQKWIAALKEGRNPLTEDEIKALLG